MLYDPSAKSRSASGAFPRGFPFTPTSASAGVERISMLPICVRRTAPDAGRDGVGLGAVGALGVLRALGAGAGATLGRSTIVSSTAASFSTTGDGVRKKL